MALAVRRQAPTLDLLLRLRWNAERADSL